MKIFLRIFAFHRSMVVRDFGCESLLRFSLALVGLGLLLGASPTTVTAESDSDTNEGFWKSIYDEHHVLEINIALTREAWESMQPARSERRGGAPRGGGRSEPSGNNYPYVKADISINGESFDDAGLRFKGNSSYRSAQGGFKRPFKIDTNRFVKGQKIYGRTKLNLSNSYLDSAFMKEKLAYELYRAAGIQTPGVGWATLTLTIEGVTEKQRLGVYVLVEQVDKQFVERNFEQATKGSLLMKPEISSNWLYPGEGPELYEPFSVKIGEDDPAPFKRFGELLQLIHSGADAAFASEIGERMDLDQFAGYLAATSLLANIDSYIGMPHNYYLLIDKADDRLRLLPWDLNESFGTFTMGSSPEGLADWDIDRPWVAELKLVERLFEIESFRNRYRSALVDLTKNTFTEENLFARIAGFEKALAPHLSEEERVDMRMGINGDSNGYNSAVGRRVFAIKPFIKKRIASVTAQLDGKSDGTKIEGRRRGGRGRQRGGR